MFGEQFPNLAARACLGEMIHRQIPLRGTGKVSRTFPVQARNLIRTQLA